MTKALMSKKERFFRVKTGANINRSQY